MLLAGYHAGAIAEYKQFVTWLGEDLGVEPMSEPLALYETFLHYRPLTGSENIRLLVASLPPSSMGR